MITQAIVQKKSYLRGYAFTNFHEFWAVSVEYFFENSQGLKDNLPQLYTILCDTLNQDPLDRMSSRPLYKLFSTQRNFPNDFIVFNSFVIPPKKIVKLAIWKTIIYF